MVAVRACTSSSAIGIHARSAEFVTTRACTKVKAHLQGMPSVLALCKPRSVGRAFLQTVAIRGDQV